MYLTLEELKEIISFIEYLNDRNSRDVGIQADLVDLNGDKVGRVDITESGDYGFYPGEGNTNELG